MRGSDLIQVSLNPLQENMVVDTQDTSWYNLNEFAGVKIIQEIKPRETKRPDRTADDIRFGTTAGIEQIAKQQRP